MSSGARACDDTASPTPGSVVSVRQPGAATGPSLAGKQTRLRRASLELAVWPGSASYSFSHRFPDQVEPNCASRRWAVRIQASRRGNSCIVARARVRRPRRGGSPFCGPGLRAPLAPSAAARAAPPRPAERRGRRRGERQGRRPRPHPPLGVGSPLGAIVPALSVVASWPSLLCPSLNTFIPSFSLRMGVHDCAGLLYVTDGCSHQCSLL